MSQGQTQDQPLPGAGAAGSLRDPMSAGRSRDPSTARDNDEIVKGIEHRIRCTCGCTLDVYTCRTTDFTCTYSPSLHREVLALQDQGKTPPQILDAFVDKYGELILMAPKPEGFNWAGYLVPGALVLLGGGLLSWLLQRKIAVQRAQALAAPAGVVKGAGASASPAELERLERALRESDE